MSKAQAAAVLGSALMLVGCSTSLKGMFDSAPQLPPTASIDFDSEPQGADAKTSIGMTCKTPCSLQVPTAAAFSVTFSREGYVPQTVPVQVQAGEDETVKFTPNPVFAELGPAPGAKKKKNTAAKPASPAPGAPTTATR